MPRKEAANAVLAEIPRAARREIRIIVEFSLFM
jgi:hypothetical protein